jgi:hypothetical protein
VKHTGYNSVLLPLSADLFRHGLGYPWTVHLSPGTYGNSIWPTHWQPSAFFPGRLRACNRSVYSCCPQRWLHRPAAFPRTGIALALPLLQRKFAPIWAGLILGAIWGLWHMPAFLLSGTQQSEWSFTAFFAGCQNFDIRQTLFKIYQQGNATFY